MRAGCVCGGHAEPSAHSNDSSRPCYTMLKSCVPPPPSLALAGCTRSLSSRAEREKKPNLARRLHLSVQSDGATRWYRFARCAPRRVEGPINPAPGSTIETNWLTARIRPDKRGGKHHDIRPLRPVGQTPLIAQVQVGSALLERGHGGGVSVVGRAVRVNRAAKQRVWCGFRGEQRG